jgi:hypothetical protein
MQPRKIILFLILSMAVAALLYYGIKGGEPQDMRIEASSL